MVNLLAGATVDHTPPKTAEQQLQIGKKFVSKRKCVQEIREMKHVYKIQKKKKTLFLNYVNQNASQMNMLFFSCLLMLFFFSINIE